MAKENDINKDLDSGVMIKIASFIVDKRNLFFLAFIIAVIFSFVSSNWVAVENSLAAYLPSTSETSIGLDLMDEEYITYGTADFMVANITYENAKILADKIAEKDYIAMVTFDDSKAHYNDFSALISLTFAYGEKDERCLECLDKVQKEFEGYDVFMSTTLGDQASETINKEMETITVVVAIIVFLVLLFTCEAYAEIPVLVITFLVASALSSGTNFLLKEISFVSDSVTIVLQLALSVDYAVIFLNKYKNELLTNPEPRSADIVALSKAIPEIFASSLTTIGGLVAMSFMQYGIGPDLAIVLIKAILLSLLAVFLLMPGLIMLFSKLMEKTKHKNFVPKIPFVGKFAYYTRFIMPIIFVGMAAVACIYSSKAPFVYGYSTLSTPKQSEQSMIKELINSTFESKTMIAINVPAGDYNKQSAFIDALMDMEEVDSTVAIASTEAMNGVMLSDKLNYREFAELLNIDTEQAELLYAAYAVDDENYGKLINGFSNYKVSFIDIFIFLHKEVEDEYVTLDDETMKMVEDAYTKIMVAKRQLQGKDHDRMLVYLNLPEESDETFNFIDSLHGIGKQIFGEDTDIIIAGESTSQMDLKKTFDRDNTVVNVVSAFAVLIVLLFTFKSAGMPVLLILVIEGCIWLNFSFPYFEGDNLFFMGYLIVSSIQMGANIDYAIVVSSRYQEVKRFMSKKDAIVDTMNYAFPTIVTSGTMLAASGVLIGQLTSDPCISGIGVALGRGTIISIIVVLFFLPQILLFGDRIIEKTSFEMDMPLPGISEKSTGIVRLDGMVRGKIEGEVVGNIHATVIGSVDVRLLSGSVEKADNPPKAPQNALTILGEEE